MRKQVFALLIILSLFNLSYQKDRHECIHDKMTHDHYIEPSNDMNSRRELQSNEYEPLRVTFDFSSLDSLASSRPAVIDYIKRQCNMAAQFLAQNLRVVRVQGNNKFPAFYSKCQGSAPPQNDKDVGIPNSDLHVYISHYEDSESSTLAFAGACALTGYNGRPTFGRATYNLAKISQNPSHEDFEDDLETTLHEITHVLGFGSWMYQYFINPATGQAYGQGNEPIVTETIRGISTQIFATPKVQEVTRRYFGCSTAKGMQLENQTDSKNSHWEATVLYNEFMSARAVSGDGAYSAFTFALLEDSGWYKAVHENADDLQWGKNQGCDFLTSCDPNKFREFRNSSSQCDFFNKGIGYSTVEQYTDNCSVPKIYNNRHCSDTTQAGGNDQYFGFHWGQESRCFESNIVDRRITSHSYSDQRCMKYECTAQGGIDVYVQGVKYTIDRTTNKASVSPKDANKYISGEVNGPANWDDFCNNTPQYCKNFCSSQGYCLRQKCNCILDFAGEDCSISCPNGNYVHNGQCLNNKNCPSGYQVNQGTKVCEVSSSSNNGNEGNNGNNGNTNANGCLLTQVLHEGNCVSVCPVGYYADSDKNCQRCNATCLTCNDNSTCSSCTEGSFLNSSKQCTVCQQGCQTCNNGTSCQSCTASYKSLIDSNGQLLCLNQCPSTHFSQQNQCLACNSGCSSCSDSLYCLTCSSSHYKYETNGKIQCLVSCPEGYQADGNRVCQQQTTQPTTCKSNQYQNELGECIDCHYSCKTCGDSAYRVYNQCTSCYDGFYLTVWRSGKGRCYNRCYSGYTLIGDQCLRPDQQ